MSPLLIAPVIWAATAFVGVTTVCWLIYRTIQAANSGWSFTKFLVDLPSVNLQTVIGLGLMIVVIMTLLAGAVINAGTIFRVQFDYEIIDKILLSVQGLLGWNAIKFATKRMTFKAGSPDDRGSSAPRRKRKKRPPVAPATTGG